MTGDLVGNGMRGVLWIPGEGYSHVGKMTDPWFAGRAVTEYTQKNTNPLYVLHDQTLTMQGK